MAGLRINSLFWLFVLNKFIEFLTKLLFIFSCCSGSDLFINDWGHYLIYEQRHLSYSQYLSWKFLVCIALQWKHWWWLVPGKPLHIYRFDSWKYPKCGFCEIWALVSVLVRFFITAIVWCPECSWGTLDVRMDLKWISILSIHWELNICHALF